MSTDHPTEFNVSGLVIFDLNDLPEVTVESDRLIAGNTAIPRIGIKLSYEELRDTAREYYALSLAIRDMDASPELDRMMTIVMENSDHSREEARTIALGMLGMGTTLDA
jgi:hypothetical protein